MIGSRMTEESFSFKSPESSIRQLTLISSVRGFQHGENPIHTLHNFLHAITPLNLTFINGVNLKFDGHLGQGASYLVSKYINSNGAAVAVKSIKPPPNPHIDKGFGERIACVLRDIEVMHHPPHSQHPNVLSLLGYGWDDKFRGGVIPFLVTEYAEYGTLRQYLRGTSVGVMHKRSLCNQIRNGLQELHRSGVVHGDLKLDNILMADSRHGTPEVKISDFGYSLLLTRKQTENFHWQKYRGTYLYNPPECINKEPLIDYRKCDVWTLGLVCWEVITNGKYFFEHALIRQLLAVQESASALELETLDSSRYVILVEKNVQTIHNRLYDLALDLCRTELEGISARIMASVFEKTLQKEPEERIWALMLLPLDYEFVANFIIDEVTTPVTSTLAPAKFSFEMFSPLQIMNTRIEVKRRLLGDIQSAASDKKSSSSRAREALFQLGIAYALGYGVEKSVMESERLLKECENRQFHTARLMLDTAFSNQSSRESKYGAYATVIQKYLVDDQSSSHSATRVWLVDWLGKFSRSVAGETTVHRYRLHAQLPIEFWGNPLAIATSLASESMVGELIAKGMDPLWAVEEDIITSQPKCPLLLAVSLHLDRILGLLTTRIFNAQSEDVNAVLNSSKWKIFAEKALYAFFYASPIERLMIHGTFVNSARRSTIEKIVEITKCLFKDTDTLRNLRTQYFDKAITMNDLDLLDVLLQVFPNENEKDEAYDTFSMFYTAGETACRRIYEWTESLSILQLISNRRRINLETFIMVSDKSGQTLLDIALASGNYSLVQWILAWDVPLNVLDKHDQTVLSRYLKALSVDTELVELLLSKGANLKLARPIYLSLVMAAVEYADQYRVLLLLEHLSIPRLIDDDGNTTIHLAATIKGNDVARMIDILVVNWPFFLSVNSTNFAGETPLSIAARAGSGAIVKCLLKHGADPSLIDPNGMNCFHHAAATLNLSALEGLSEVASEHLLSATCSRPKVPEAVTAAGGEPKNACLQTPIDIAMEVATTLKGTSQHYTAEKFMKILSDQMEKIPIDHRSRALIRSTLHYAAFKLDVPKLKLFVPLRRRIDRWYRAWSDEKQTLAHSAVEGHTFKFKTTNAPLLISGRIEFRNAFRFLREAGFKLDTKDLQGRSCLSLAIMKNNLEAVDELLTYNHDVGLKEDQVSLWTTALQVGNQEILKILKREMPDGANFHELE